MQPLPRYFLPCFVFLLLVPNPEATLQMQHSTSTTTLIGRASQRQPPSLFLRGNINHKTKPSTTRSTQDNAGISMLLSTRNDLLLTFFYCYGFYPTYRKLCGKSPPPPPDFKNLISRKDTVTNRSQGIQLLRFQYTHLSVSHSECSGFDFQPLLWFRQTNMLRRPSSTFNRPILGILTEVLFARQRMVRQIRISEPICDRLHFYRVH
jgi:hypothetical protein